MAAAERWNVGEAAVTAALGREELSSLGGKGVGEGAASKEGCRCGKAESGRRR